MRFFTIHVRLTRDCNAHCTYCSAVGGDSGRMSPADYRRAIDFLADHVFPRLRIGAEHHVTIEYLGGEVLVVPDDELRQAVQYARSRLSPLVRTLRDGVQTNLIGAPRRILSLHDLFEGNLSTSWDPYSGQRMVKGRAELYTKILETSLKTLDAERDHKPGRVIVVDRKTAPFILQDIRTACREGYDLTLRPVFQGRSGDTDALAPADLTDLMERAYDVWTENPTVRVQPFYSLLHRRLNRAAAASKASRNQGCPFQSDCAFKSISLDPDGTLHVCQEMADAGNYPLGNALEGSFDEPTWRLLARRTARLSSDCASCEWRVECGGGCMNEAIEAHGDPFAKTELCPAWKSIFRRIEADIPSGRAARIERTVI